jgi:ribosome biogenesis protein Nip4
MTKRFTIRKVKVHSRTHHGWILKTHEEYAVYDREWKKNMEMSGRYYYDVCNSEWKYVERIEKKEIAQFWASWLNENCSEQFGKIQRVPMKICQQCLDLYHK